MLTDIHTHAFHPKIARHAVEHLNEAYQVNCVGEGTIADLLLREKRSGIGRCVVLCAATTPGQVVPANDYAVTLQREHPEVTAFGTLHPGYEAWESQLERLKAAGIRGLKLHPDFQHFWLDDPRLLPMYLPVPYRGQRTAGKESFLPVQAGGAVGSFPAPPLHRRASRRVSSVGTLPQGARGARRVAGYVKLHSVHPA